MFIEVEQQIKQALEKAFVGFPEIAGNIELAIGRENVLKETPIKMPAIRILFMQGTSREENDITGTEFISELEYAVLLFFRSFKDKTAQNIYTYLKIIQSTLKNLQTTKGILKPKQVKLEITESFYVYAYSFSIDTII